MKNLGKGARSNLQTTCGEVTGLSRSTKRLRPPSPEAHRIPRFIDYCIRLGQERKKVSIGYWKWRHREDKLNLNAVELHGKQCKKKKMLILNVKNLIHFLGYREKKKIKCTDIYIFKGITLFSCLCILLIRTFGSTEVVYFMKFLGQKKRNLKGDTVFFL